MNLSVITMSDKFKTINTIVADDNSTWKDKLFLTFDVDWACDDILIDSIDLVERADVAATWFITHDSPALDRLRENPKFELGIHPNFNPLLEKENLSRQTIEEVIERLLDIVPDAKSVRSHSMFQSSRIQKIFYEYGLYWDANHYVPEQTDIILKPWKLWTGATKVPHFWEDDLAAIYERFNSFSSLQAKAGLKVFDFHPIHVFLNMSDIEQYEKTREIHKNPDELVLHRNYIRIGSRDVLSELLEWK